MPEVVELDEKREHEQARLGALGIIALNNSKATRSAVNRLISKKIRGSGYAMVNDRFGDANVLMIGLEDGPENPQRKRPLGPKVIQEIIAKGSYPSVGREKKTPILYLAISNVSDAQARQIAAETGKNICYCKAGMVLDIDKNGDIHLRPRSLGVMAFVAPSKAYRMNFQRAVYYPRALEMNAIVDKIKEAPTESDRIKSWQQFDIIGEDDCLEIISNIKNEQGCLYKELCSPELGGGGHLLVTQGTGKRTIVLETHGFVSDPVSEEERRGNILKLNEILSSLRHVSNRRKATKAILTCCRMPPSVVSDIAKKLGIIIWAGKQAPVTGIGLLENEGLSGDFKLFCEKGFSIFYPDGRQVETNSDFLLLPRAPKISRKVAQQAMTAYMIPTLDTSSVQKEILEAQFFSLANGHQKDLEYINATYSNKKERLDLKRKIIKALKEEQDNLLHKLSDLGYVLDPRSNRFISIADTLLNVERAQMAFKNSKRLPGRPKR